MEEMILEEVQQFITFLRPMAADQQMVDLSRQFNLPILNALWRITVGDRFEYTDPCLLDIVKRMADAISRLGSPSAVLAITQPWLFKEDFYIQDSMLFTSNRTMDQEKNLF
jgi:Cytochrome P450